MGKKIYLKIFNNQNDYEAVKKSLMGIPHVIWLKDSDEILYVDGGRIEVENYDNNIVITNAVDVINGQLILDADNIIADGKNNQFNLIIE